MMLQRLCLRPMAWLDMGKVLIEFEYAENYVNGRIFTCNQNDMVILIKQQ